MLDISFTELVFCLVIALIVLGPEKLPRVARTVGRWAGQAKVYMRNLSTELERETQSSELKKQLQEANRQLREQAGAAREAVRKIGDDLPPRP
ncbi:MAG: Sec-independent protein translocase protein TatB [Gammaproteobacteria bacterium]|jgi:sec-independent protein translocase protein TatB